MHVASGRIKSLQRLYLTGTFQWNAIKASIEATQEYEHLHNKVCSSKKKY